MAEDRLARLRALVEQWRKAASGKLVSGDDYWDGQRQALSKCAAELEGVLAIPPQPPEDKKEGARVAPLKAGVDGQDLPQSGSGEKSPL